MRPVEVYLSFFTEVHKGQDFEDIKEMLKEFKVEYILDQKSEQLFYLEKVNDILPMNMGLDVWFSQHSEFQAKQIEMKK